MYLTLLVGFTLAESEEFQETAHGDNCFRLRGDGIIPRPDQVCKVIFHERIGYDQVRREFTTMMFNWRGRWAHVTFVQLSGNVPKTFSYIDVMRDRYQFDADVLRYFKIDKTTLIELIQSGW